MPFAWPRPVPLILMAAPFLLLWAPTRALVGEAVSRLPTSGGMLSNALSRWRRCGATLRQQPCSATASSVAEGSGRRKDGGRKVIVIAGPTATGKSSIALEVCKRLGGEIVSCDSVQVYRDVHIGCNKPSPQERRNVRHHLVDVASLRETFAAGEFVDRAQEAIDDILARGRVPVVVGGTMMYVQWLIHGKPDAPKKDPAVAQAVAAELLPFYEQKDWNGALQVLTAISQRRADSLYRNDWYRLSRSLEILRSSGEDNIFTGLRTPPVKDYDFRPFFIVGDRERMFRRIDSRCEDMLRRGLLTETADLLARGLLDPASPAGRAIGYRQAIEFLLQEAALTGRTKEDNAGASTGRKDCSEEDPSSRFLHFFATFAARTRQYAADQIKWFRSSKGRDFSWQVWDLGGEIEETSRAPLRGGRASSSFARLQRSGDGRSWRDAASSICAGYGLSREEFDEELGGEEQGQLREGNLKRARDMKRYVPNVSFAEDRQALVRLVQETEGLVRELRDVQLFAQSATGSKIEGWHAGSR